MPPTMTAALLTSMPALAARIVPLSTSAPKMVLSRMLKPVSATMVPTLTTLPRKVPTLVSSTPAWPAEMVPAFVIPPAMLPAPKTATVLTSIPPSLAKIFPVLLLTMLPRKVPTLVRSMPA